MSNQPPYFSPAGQQMYPPPFAPTPSGGFDFYTAPPAAAPATGPVFSGSGFHQESTLHQRFPSTHQGSAFSGPGEGGPFFEPPNSLVVNFGMQYGQRMFRRTKDNLSRYFFTAEILKYYFRVNNSYVKNKLRLVLCPWGHKFQRRIAESYDGTYGPSGASVAAGGAEYLPPADDVNAPDMYIPLMSVVTYVLLVGVARGVTSSFSPDVLAATLSSCFLLLLCEMFLIRVFASLTMLPRPFPILDLVCWLSYKYVTVCACLLLRPVVFTVLYTPLWLALSALQGMFVFQCLRSEILTGSNSYSDLTPIQSYFLFAVAAFQIPVCFWLMRV
eukprot:TRINITY_DN8757_c0_g1_i2.p1 TRINITY_DN8757_c0_g1~~TRINITY_DN8757_c0_g1_i2.p1  ORF type:complete len:329 (-),score=48.77 TRINITY_DN8757_c0_g1_i2:15-1001(-)